MTSTSDSNITPTVADCGRVSELALSVYKSCRSSAEDFQNMAYTRPNRAQSYGRRFPPGET
ncbi:uncharacterized protein BJX67DRAFT_367653, partial [Aspergillus lucknowensis]